MVGHELDQWIPVRCKLQAITSPWMGAGQIADGDLLGTKMCKMASMKHLWKIKEKIQVVYYKQICLLLRCIVLYFDNVIFLIDFFRLLLWYCSSYVVDRARDVTLNSYPPSAAYMCQWTGPALLMAWCLFSTKHYLNQCWRIVNWTLRNKLQWNSNQNTKSVIHENAFKNRLRNGNHFQDQIRKN